MKLRPYLEPFSSFGSWFSVCQQTPQKYVTCAFGDGVYIRCHHGEGIEPNEVFKLEALEDGRVVEADVEADASEMRVTAGEGTVRITFDPQGGLRFCGHGLGLRFRAPGWVAYSEGPELFTVNATKFKRRFQFECLQGGLQWDAPWTGERCAHIVLDLIPDTSGTCEVALEECTSTCVPSPERDSYSELRKQSEVAFHDFCSSHGEGPVDPDLSDAWIRSMYVNWSSCVRPEGLLTRTTMLMSKHWMDRVWSWDHCFNAQALMYGPEALAWDQLMLMFDHQDAFGALPDAVTDTRITFNFCKPPVHGWTVLELLNASAEPSVEFLQQAFEHLSRHTEWFLTHRTLPGMTLPYYLHGNDSGWDNSTMFDQGVPLMAPDLTALLVVQCEALADLAEKLSNHGNASLKEQTQTWHSKRNSLLEALIHELWDGDCFRPLRLVDGKTCVPVESNSLIPFIPIFLGRRLPEDILTKLATGLERFVTDHGIATEAPDSPEYTEDGYWRGPVWAPSTYIIYTGLKQAGFDELAERIRQGFLRTCEAGGFAENFNALTGAPLRDKAYTWTASVFLLLARPLS